MNLPRVTKEIKYHKNEWVVIWLNDMAEEQVSVFDLKADAIDFAVNCNYCITITTTAFYNTYIARETIDLALTARGTLKIQDGEYQFIKIR